MGRRLVWCLELLYCILKLYFNVFKMHYKKPCTKASFTKDFYDNKPKVIMSYKVVRQNTVIVPEYLICPITCQKTSCDVVWFDKVWRNLWLTTTHCKFEKRLIKVKESFKNNSKYWRTTSSIPANSDEKTKSYKVNSAKPLKTYNFRSVCL